MYVCYLLKSLLLIIWTSVTLISDNSDHSAVPPASCSWILYNNICLYSTNGLVSWYHACLCVQYTFWFVAFDALVITSISLTNAANTYRWFVPCSYMSSRYSRYATQLCFGDFLFDIIQTVYYVSNWGVQNTEAPGKMWLSPPDRYISK